MLLVASAQLGELLPEQQHTFAGIGNAVFTTSHRGDASAQLGGLLPGEQSLGWHRHCCVHSLKGAEGRGLDTVLLP
jgi:hypothetical protein